MKREAKWKSALTNGEMDELDMARGAHDATGLILRETTRKLKDRCIKRMRRKDEINTMESKATNAD